MSFIERGHEAVQDSGGRPVQRRREEVHQAGDQRKGHDDAGGHGKRQ